MRYLAAKVPIGAILFLLFFSTFVFGMSGWIQYGDEIEKYRVAQSLVERHEFSFRPTEMRNEVGVGGRTYSIYEMGQTLWEVPFYLLGKFAYQLFPQPDSNSVTLLFVGLLDPLISALCICLLYVTSCSLGFRTRTSLVLAVVFGLATILWPYSKGFTREPLLTLLILLSVYTAHRFARSGRERWVIASGLVAGYLTFTKFIQAMVIPFLGLYLAIVVIETAKRQRHGRWMTLARIGRVLGLYLSPLIFFIGLQSLYGLQRFGNLYAGIAGTKLNPVEWILFLVGSSHPADAIYGLLFSPEKSVFLYSPPILLGCVGLVLWVKAKRREALLFFALVAIEFASAFLRPDWSGGSWWGPRYLVQITPLLIIPLGAWLESPNESLRKIGRVLIAVAFGLGVIVQLAGVTGSDRDYLDTTGEGTALAGQIDFLRHGVFESLLVHVPESGVIPRLNPFGICLIADAVLMGGLIMWRDGRRRRDAPTSRAVGAAWILVTLLIESAAFLAWVVVPYSSVLAEKANDKYLAGNSFLAEGRLCDAGAMYLMALERGTTFQKEAGEQLRQLLPHAKGTPIRIDEMSAKEDIGGDATIEKDDEVTFLGTSSLRISGPLGSDVIATATSRPFEVLPNATYELFGWTRTQMIYGEGYAVVAIYEDDGGWRDGRDTDAKLMDETRGWQPFRKIVTTLPTTKRLVIKTSLWKSYGTVWIAGLELAQIQGPVPAAWGGHGPCPVQRFK